MSTISDWLTHARGERHSKSEDNNWDDLRAIDALETLLIGGQSASIVAETISNIYEPGLKVGYRTDVVSLWGIISDATRSLDGIANVRLVDLIIEIHELPDLTTSEGDPIKEGGMVYWRDLPRWGMMFREYGIEIDPPDGASDWYKQAAQLMNASIFAATLLARANWDCGMHFHASNALSAGIERPYDTQRELRDEWRVYLPPAAMWIIIAGEKLYKLCSGAMFYASVNRQIYNLAKWESWERQFIVLAASEEIDKNGRSLAARAGQKMKEIKETN